MPPECLNQFFSPTSLLHALVVYYSSHSGSVCQALSSVHHYRNINHREGIKLSRFHLPVRFMRSGQIPDRSGLSIDVSISPLIATARTISWSRSVRRMSEKCLQLFVVWILICTTSFRWMHSGMFRIDEKVSFGALISLRCWINKREIEMLSIAVVYSFETHLHP